MVIYTKNSVRIIIPYLFAYASGIFGFPFFGTETYTDPYDGSVWTWENVTNNIDEIVQISIGGVDYTRVLSYADCAAAEETFFWDDVNGILYVRNLDNDLDVINGSTERRYASVNAGYATGYNKNNKNVFDGIYYETRIQDFSEITRTVDPVQLGLVSFDSLSYSLINQDGKFDNYTESEAVGSPFFVYAMDEDSTETIIDETNQVYQGYHRSATNTRQSLNIEGVERRFFSNEPVCVNTINTTDYPNCGDVAGEFYPVAFGQIRRGIAVPTNIETLTEGSAGSCVLLLSDPDVSSLTSVTAVYDKDGNSLAIVSTSLSNCTVTVTKPADIDPNDTKDYTWAGVGYAITGTETNGLDIIKFCFLYFSKILYNSTFYDTVQWAAQTAIKTDTLGISVQTDKGWMEEILQPISASLQIVIEFLGNGKLTVFSRNFSGGSALNLEYSDIIEDTDINIMNEVVSDVLINYAQNFKTGKYLSTVYDDDKPYVVNNYGIKTRGDLSPLDTLLYSEAQALLLAENLMNAYKDPAKYFRIDIEGILDSTYNLFGLVEFDASRINNTTAETITAEIFEINYDYIRERTKLLVREYRG